MASREDAEEAHEESREVSVFGRGTGRDRSYQQLCLLAAVGRAARARSRLKKANEQRAHALVEFTESINMVKAARAPRLKVVARGGLVVLKQGKGDRSRYVLTFQEMLRMAFAKRRCRNAAADAYAVSQRTVRRVLAVTAHCILETQMSQMKEFERYVLSHTPDFAAAVVMWDETSEKLSLNAVHGTARCQQASTWQVLVSRVHLTLGWINGVKLYREFVTPPVPLTSNSSDNVHAGLFCHPFTKCLLDAVRSILLAARKRAIVHEVDGHLANERLHFHRYALEKERRASSPSEAKPVLTDIMLCQNHQTNLVMTATVANVVPSADSGGKMLPNLYCTTLFLRMGGHFVRLLASLQYLIESESFFEWRPWSCEPQPAGHECRAELAAYLIDNLRHGDRQMSASDPGPKTSAWRQSAENIKTAFNTVLNGPSWERHRLCHICIGRCCRDRKEAEGKVVWACVRVLMRKMPVVPLVSDWTKLMPNIDFFLSTDHQGLLSSLLAQASWAFKFPQKEPSMGEDGGDGDSGKVDWHALAGRRFRRCRQMMESTDERWRRSMLAVILEPLRHCHSTFLKHAHSAADDESWPLLFDELWPSKSKSVGAQQYLSTLLAGSGSRLRLIWQVLGHQSMEQWMCQRPEQAKEVRSLMLMVCMLTQRRYEATVNRWPWKLFALADPRRSDHEEMFKAFFSLPPCCLPAGFAREIREDASEETFLAELLHWRWFFVSTAMLLKLSVAHVERRHAVHKRNANPQMPWEMFSADSILSEATYVAGSLDRMRKERAQRQAGCQALSGNQRQSRCDALALTDIAPVANPVPSGSSPLASIGVAAVASPVPSGSAAPQRARLRAQNPFELFKWEWLQTQKKMGKQWNPASKEFYAAVRKDFGELSPEKLEALGQAASASKVRAACVRRQLKLQAAAAVPPVENLARAGGLQQIGDAPTPTPTLIHLVQPPPCVPNPSQLSNALSLPQLESGRPRPPYSKHMACFSLSAPLLQQAAGQAQHLEKQTYPLSRDILKQRMASKSYKLKADCEAFAAKAAHIASAGGLPAQVAYPAKCGALCRSSTSARVLGFHSRVVKLLLQLVTELSPDRSLSLAHRANLLIAAESFANTDDESPTSVDFFVVACAAGRQAHHPASVSLAELSHVSGPAFPPYVPRIHHAGPLILKHARLPFAQSVKKLRPPLDQADFGRLKYFSEDAFAGKLCSPGQLPGMECVAKIGLVPLTWKFASASGFDSYVITGLHQLETEYIAQCALVLQSAYPKWPN
ncbi:unnamed protein product [Effrenium voratum]|nr:unnamed protein product [Effrenium voratum]